MIIIINVNSFPERFFEGFQLIVFANKRAFMKKNCTAYNPVQLCAVQLYKSAYNHCDTLQS